MPIKRLMDKAKDWLGFARSVKAPPEAHAKFLLTYGDLLVGTLTVEEGVWKFEYSDTFKSEHELRPIVEFPDLNKIYEILENDILPLYYDDFDTWRQIVKNGMRDVEFTFDSNRMVEEYYDILYK